MKKRRFWIFVPTLALAGIMTLAVVISALLLGGGMRTTNPRVTSPAATTEPATEAPPAPSIVRLMAVGDNLIHNSIYQQAQKRAGGTGYDFRFAYDNVRDILAQADLSVINQETPVAGAIAPPASFPMFNSPVELGDEVYSLGFRAVNLSNNHMLDQWSKGVLASLDYWESKEGVVTSGAYRNEEDFKKTRLLEVNGITFGFVSATYGYNGLQLPAGSELILPLLEDEDRIRAAVEAARAAADVVVASMHWGNENSQTVIEAQRSLARKLADWGADIILGTHPHVLQGMEWLERPAEQGGRVFVAYSLGNFISAQSQPKQLIGGILDMEVTKDNQTGKITLATPKFKPVITQYGGGYSNLHVVPWTSYTPELANSHGVRRESSFSYEYCKNLLQETIPQEFLDLT